MSVAPNLAVFQEPRGVMRILQFIFSICAFATTSGFTNQVIIYFCEASPNSMKYSESAKLSFSYPFQLDRISTEGSCSHNNITQEIYLVGDFSSDAQFFVATGVLSMLYCIGITAVYVMLDAIYQSNAMVPAADFVATVILAVFWLSGSAAWANGLTGLKAVTSFETIKDLTYCPKLMCLDSGTDSFSSLTISVILGFLNFFLWASDLWFLYKETLWFKGTDVVTSPTAVTGGSSGYM